MSNLKHERTMTPTKECLFFMAENERLRYTDVIYFEYVENEFLGGHTTTDTIDLTRNPVVYECDKINRQSHRVF